MGMAMGPCQAPGGEECLRKSNRWGSQSLAAESASDSLLLAGRGRRRRPPPKDCVARARAVGDRVAWPVACTTMLVVADWEPTQLLSGGWRRCGLLVGLP